MIQRISDLVEPSEQVKDDVASDAMKQTFASNKAYELQNDKRKGISLSSIQKALLDKHLFFPRMLTRRPHFLAQIPKAYQSMRNIFITSSLLRSTRSY